MVPSPACNIAKESVPYGSRCTNQQPSIEAFSRHLMKGVPGRNKMNGIVSVPSRCTTSADSICFQEILFGEAHRIVAIAEFFNGASFEWWREQPSFGRYRPFLPRGVYRKRSDFYSGTKAKGNKNVRGMLEEC